MKYILILLFLLLSLTVNSAVTKSCLEQTLSSLSTTPYKTAGSFEMAPKTDQARVVKAFLKLKGKFTQDAGKIAVNRFFKKDLLTDLASMTGKQLKALKTEGFKNINKLSIVTSGAGLWSRGGGAIKALVPYNLKELLGADFKLISKAGKIVKAKNNEEILKIAGKTNVPKSKVDEVAKKIATEAKADIKRLLSKIQYDKNAMTPLDIKFINVALYSKKGNTYVPFDIWTSEQTHEEIAKYVTWLKKNYKTKKLHKNPKTDAKIKEAMKEYFKKAEANSDTHLLGHQEGFHAIDVATGTYKTDTASIGQGAGAIVEYMKTTGRMDQLAAMGKSDVVFENIEVVSDMPALYASHVRGKKPVSVVLVPQKEGYAGGSPFLVEKSKGKFNLELVEGTVLPDELKKGNDYFNSNTIFFSNKINPVDEIAFELKEQDTIARVKLNIGDITKHNETAGIGGRVGRDQKMVEYENFKSYDEYGDNGAWYIGLFQDSWDEMTK